MAESNVYKVLYQGQLGNTVATLATVGGGKGWIIRNITVVNTDSSARTYALYINGTTAAFQITPSASSLGAQETDVFDDMLALNAADTIAGGASVATKVTVTITGDEVTY
jgi:hypothetical protein